MNFKTYSYLMKEIVHARQTEEIKTWDRAVLFYSKQIIRHTVDLAAIAIILAAIKKQTGYTLSFGPNNEFNHLAKMYTSMGSYMYEKVIGWVKKSSYFKKTNVVEDFVDNVSKTFTQLGTDVTDNVVRPTQPECD